MLEEGEEDIIFPLIPERTQGLFSTRSQVWPIFAQPGHITPQWCNSLARLGCEVSKLAIDAMSRAGALSSAWEQLV